MNETRAIVIHNSLSDHQVIICMWDYHCGKKGSTKNENLNENANKIHYAKTLEKIYNTDWNDWIEMHKNNDTTISRSNRTFAILWSKLAFF